MLLDQGSPDPEQGSVITLHASRDFVKRFKCQVSLKDQEVAQPGNLYAWSVHVIRAGRSPVVVAMNDASLYTLLIPATGVTKYSAFLKILLPAIEKTWAGIGEKCEAPRHSVMVVRRTNRSLMGSMNEAVRILRWYHELTLLDGSRLDVADVEARINETPFKAIDYKNPLSRLIITIRDHENGGNQSAS